MTGKDFKWPYTPSFWAKGWAESTIVVGLDNCNNFSISGFSDFKIALANVLPFILKKRLKNSSFLIYGLGITGRSVVNFFNRKKIKKYSIWDDNFKGKTKFYIKNIDQLKYNLKRVDFIVLSPGISLKKVKFKKELIKFKTKIITDIDLFYLFYDKPKTIVVTGSNGR